MMDRTRFETIKLSQEIREEKIMDRQRAAEEEWQKREVDKLERSRKQLRDLRIEQERELARMQYHEGRQIAATNEMQQKLRELESSIARLERQIEDTRRRPF
mmetsp:Transcript_21499/g.61245  ORF Transcript_21499/g.61245 Transcript_21499/m.61245 type:complete len:102 (+) Transcript_21499:33-338(+)